MSATATTVDETPQQIVGRDIAAQVQGEREGQLSSYTCPECHGALWQVTEANTPEFHCHVGHVLSGEVLLYGQQEALEASLWASIRGLADMTRLARQLACQAARRGEEAAAQEYEEQAQATEEQGRALRQLVEGW